MAYNYAQKDINIFNTKLSQGVLTQPLETPEVDWLNAQSFTVRNLACSGYRPHTRDKGYNLGTLVQQNTVYVLSFDRDIEFFVDIADVDETNLTLAAGNISRTFIEEQVQPEVDAYRFSKLYAFADGNGKAVSEAITPANVYTRLKQMLLPVRRYGPANLIVYLSSHAMDCLERCEDFVRTIENRTVGETTLESRVSTLDGVQLVEVWDEKRFFTAYDFSEGFVPQEDAGRMNILVVAKPAVVCKAKFNSVYLFAPGEHTQGNGCLYQNRLYHDLWVLEKQTGAVYASIQAGGPEAP